MFPYILQRFTIWRPYMNLTQHEAVIPAMVEAQFKGWNLDEVLKDPWYVKCDNGPRRAAGCVRTMEELPMSLKVCMSVLGYKPGKDVRKQITK